MVMEYDGNEHTERAPISTLNATKGGLLQAVLGEKTLNIGLDTPKPGLHFLTNSQDASLRVPVMLVGVQEKVPFSAITEEQARAAGYSSKERMGERILNKVRATTKQEGPNPNRDHDLQWLNNDSRWSLATIRLATKEEISKEGEPWKNVRDDVRHTVASIFADPDITVDRALTKLGKGENALKLELANAIDKQFGSKERAA